MSEFVIKVGKFGQRSKVYKYSYGTKAIWMAIGKRTSAKKKGYIIEVLYKGSRGMEFCSFKNGVKEYCSEDY
jgi:hypothetical protein